jgi:hypothetical protein
MYLDPEDSALTALLKRNLRPTHLYLHLQHFHLRRTEPRPKAIGRDSKSLDDSAVKANKIQALDSRVIFAFTEDFW